VNRKVKGKLFIFFHIKAILHKDASWQSKQSIPHSALMFYEGCVEMWKEFSPKFGDEEIGCCMMKTHQFSLGDFNEKKKKGTVITLTCSSLYLSQNIGILNKKKTII
jgi:hypothetical protein